MFLSLVAGATAFAPSNGAFRLMTRQPKMQRLSPLFLSTADFKNGLTIEFGGAPWRVLEFLHVKPGKGSAFVRTKVKNLLNGNVNEKTWRAGESVDAASVTTEEMQYTYAEEENYVFMNMESFEEARIPISVVGDKKKYLSEGTEIKALLWNDKCIDCQLPTSMNIRVASTEPGIRGNTAQGVTKPATLETGAVIMVPGFICEGELVKVNTEKDEYTSRVKE